MHFLEDLRPRQDGGLSNDLRRNGVGSCLDTLYGNGPRIDLRPRQDGGLYGNGPRIDLRPRQDGGLCSGRNGVSSRLLFTETVLRAETAIVVSNYGRCRFTDGHAV